ncbi:hypothetical protein PIROE2DRAFT_10263 [Piromyces sp. E2]|nr:hypothetical protein PIROE2DRAFT_10263 [Piromyces sp. E2]|eukprot:OUM63236.1 hypothetical protein PIROE2DRAFT_10263 [Piromyces sp. E2]
MAGYIDGQVDYILVFDNFKNSEIDSENVKQLVENSIRNVIIGSNVVEEKQYNKRYFNEEEEEEEEENENEIVDKEILYDLNCIEDNNEVCDIYKNELSELINKFNDDLTINRELKLEVFIDSITDNGYTSDVQLAELNEKFEDLISGTQYPKHEEMAGYIDGQVDYILVFDNFKNGEIDSENIKKLVENSIRNVIIGSNVVEEKHYNKRYFIDEENCYDDNNVNEENNDRTEVDIDEENNNENDKDGNDSNENDNNEIVEETSKDELFYDITCIEDNNEVCNIYKNALNQFVHKFNIDGSMERELRLEVFVDSIIDNGYSKGEQLAELNNNFEDITSGTKYPNHEELAKYINQDIKSSNENVTDMVLVFDNFKYSEDFNINTENITKIVEDAIGTILVGSNIVDEVNYKKYKDEL